MKVLITGSRDYTQEMGLAVSYVIDRLAARRHSVICGDAEGIDDLVINTCSIRRVYTSVWGAYGRLKRQSGQTDNSDATVTHGDYLARDRRMAEVCDMCIAIWNCKSRGTKYTYDYCLKLGKPSIILAFPAGVEHDLARDLLKLFTA